MINAPGDRSSQPWLLVRPARPLQSTGATTRTVPAGYADRPGQDRDGGAADSGRSPGAYGGSTDRSHRPGGSPAGFRARPLPYRPGLFSPAQPGIPPVDGPRTQPLPTIVPAPGTRPDGLTAEQGEGGRRPADPQGPAPPVAARPWSVMKTSFLFSIAAGIMLVVAVYASGPCSARRLFESVNEIVASVVSTPGDTTRPGWRTTSAPRRSWGSRP